MAFELTDFYRTYTPRGEDRGLFNVSRSDESAASPRYYLYLNEVGSYVIQKITLAAGIGTYEYYARKAKKGVDTATNLAADWTGRAGLSYVEYFQLFLTDD